MRNWTSELLIPHSDALPLSHRDSTVSGIYYKELYYEVPSLIPHGDSELFILSPIPDKTKSSSSVQWKFKRGQLFVSLHRFENSSNIDTAIQIFLYLPMSGCDSQLLYNICIVRLQGLLLFTSDNIITNPYQFSALEQKENSLCEQKCFWLIAF